MHAKIISGLKGYIKFWQNLSSGSFVPRYYMLVIDYWSNVIEELGKPIHSEERNYTNFWPKSEGSHQLDDMNVEQLKTQIFLGIEEHNDHHCGITQDKPSKALNPMLHVQKGQFVMLHLATQIFSLACYG